MKLYFGINFEKGNEILQQRFINFATASENNIVHLTDLISSAIYYGNQAEISDTTTGKFYLFQIELDELEMQPVLDKPNTVIVARNLALGSDVIAYAVLPVTTNEEHELSYITKESVKFQNDANPTIPASVEQIVWQELSY
ncbi:MAG TPA: hypothetical protein VGE40_05845 [Bacilli bacterium]